MTTTSLKRARQSPPSPVDPQLLDHDAKSVASPPGGSHAASSFRNVSACNRHVVNPSSSSPPPSPQTIPYPHRLLSAASANITYTPLSSLSLLIHHATVILSPFLLRQSTPPGAGGAAKEGGAICWLIYFSWPRAPSPAPGAINLSSLTSWLTVVQMPSPEEQV